MAFQHPQQRRTRHVPQRQDSSPLLEDLGELSTSVDSEVLLFGGQSSNALRLSSAAVPSSSTIDQSWALLHNRAQSPASSTQRSSSISTTSSSRTGGGHASPASLTHSLFPSHDGNGIFIAGSLVQSDEGGLGTGATYATEEEGDLDSSLPSGSSALSDASSSSFSGADARGRHKGLHAPPGGSSISGSWALTEEALSTVPHATPLGGAAAVLNSGSGSADFTEESSDDESLEGIVVGRRRTPTRRLAGQQLELEDDEVLLSATPHAASAGMLSEAGRGGEEGAYNRRYEWKEDDNSTRSREAYPSPPPEDALVGRRIRIKRRHRQSGRNAGSQKRSSASGSIAGAEAVVASPLHGLSSRRSQEVAAQQFEEDKTRRTKAETDVLFGGIASRLMEIDTATLELVAAVRAPPTPEATPTPSRSTSPTPHLVTPRHHSRKEAHGVQALAQHARDELGDSTMYSLSGGEDEDDSGDETETEVDHSPKLVQQKWLCSSTPPIFAPRRAAVSSSSPSTTTPPPRTTSASSLPLYFSDALAPLTHTNLVNSASTLKSPDVPLIRRTSSYSSSGAALPGGEENPWGGELEGFEAAMSYWRRLLRRMRGF